MYPAQGKTGSGEPTTLRPMIWLCSSTVSAPMLPAAWLIATDCAPANLAERSALRRETARDIIARQLGIAADALSIDHDANGRPLLLHPAAAGLHLSLATRAGHVAVALARGPVGVDIEQVAPLTEPPLAALHPGERAALLSLPASQRACAFARLWSAKEAYVKSLGVGFIRAPESFCVSLDCADRFSVADPERKGPIRGLGRLINKNGGQGILAAAMVMLD